MICRPKTTTTPAPKHGVDRPRKSLVCVDSEPTDPLADVLTMPPTGSPYPVASTCLVVPLAGPST